MANTTNQIRAMNLHKIKYRAYDLKKDQMLYTDWDSFRNWYDAEKLGVAVIERGDENEKRRLSKPMQFTEFYDKNSEELYEDDLVLATYVEKLGEWPEFNFKNIIQFNSIFQVKKIKGCFGLVNESLTIWFHDLILVGENRILKSKDFNMKDGFNKRYYKFVNFKKIGTIFDDPKDIRKNS